MTRLLCLVLLTAACGVPQEEIGEKAGEAWCKRAVKCGDLAGDDEEACIDSIEAGVDLLVGVGTGFGAEYDPGGAGRCVREIRSLSCDELDDWSAEGCDLFEDSE